VKRTLFRSSVRLWVVGEDVGLEKICNSELFSLLLQRGIGLVWKQYNFNDIFLWKNSADHQDNVYSTLKTVQSILLFSILEKSKFYSIKSLNFLLPSGNLLSSLANVLTVSASAWTGSERLESASLTRAAITRPKMMQPAA